jgi:hypothetical protein
MPISQFKEKFVAGLKINPIREKQLIFNENDFEQKFVMPIASDIKNIETDVFLFNHPWNREILCTPDCMK